MQPTQISPGLRGGLSVCVGGGSGCTIPRDPRDSSKGWKTGGISLNERNTYQIQQRGTSLCFIILRRPGRHLGVFIALDGGAP